MSPTYDSQDRLIEVTTNGQSTFHLYNGNHMEDCRIGINSALNILNLFPQNHKGVGQRCRF